MTYNGLPLYKLTITDEFDSGVEIMSIVSQPAVQVNFLKFSEDEEIKYHFNFDSDKHIITGPAIIANKPIYRRNEYGEFYVTFDDDTIKSIAEKFMAQQRTVSVNINHDTMVDGCVIIESFFIDHERNIVPKEFENLPDNSWIISMKVNNEDTWKAIKNSELNGFSIEGLFNVEEIVGEQMSSQVPEEKVVNDNFLDWLWNQFND